MTIVDPPRLAPIPEVGQLVRVRDRHWVVSEVVASVLNGGPGQHLVELASVEDDALGDELRVIWEIEPGAAVLETATLPRPHLDRFDDPERLDAFLDAVRWGAITSADSRALQAPFRSGITIEDYQLDPVVRALQMPRVNLLIADDVGLGKTIEAGLVVQELLLRHRARTVLVVCPASLTLKWKAEMADRFGLDFQVVDTAMLRELRRTRGMSANPFRSYPRLIVSIDWLKRPKAMRLLRDVLPPDAHAYPRRFDLLIVDEVHTCAPAGRGRYARDSQRTEAIRTIAPHFEHRLFLSATPHNGYTESFTALLELLDPQRFARGVIPRPDSLARVLVRRLKSELRDELGPNPDGTPRFAKRVIVPIEVRYPEAEHDAHAKLARYAQLRGKHATSRTARTAADFVTLLLKKRLFSSPAAFAHTLDVHMRTVAREAASAREAPAADEALHHAFARLDEEVEYESEVTEATEDALVAAARYGDVLDSEELELLRWLSAWATDARGRPDAKAERLLDWIEEACTKVDDTGQRWWNDERVIVFTEYRDTQVWLEQLLTARGLGGDRLSLLYGGMDADARERIKGEFQHAPERFPLRILLATDAASEGIDLQRHCHRMVHVEIPFSPTRLEQRNGRIDRHGQPAPEVLIHHFVGEGWESAAGGSLEADLGFLSRVAHKVETIRDDLGSVGPVLAEQVERKMLGLPADIERRPREDRSRAARALNRIERNLREEVDRLREQLDASVEELGLNPDAVERVVQTALELARQPSLQQMTLVRDDMPDFAAKVFSVPSLTRSWALAAADVVDPLTGDRLPVTFDHAVAAGADDVVLAHLGHRLVAQSLRLLRAEIWSSGSDVRLGRVCARVANIDEPVVVAHARLVLTGGDGHRLHEEVVQAGGRISRGRFARYNVGQLREALVAATPDDAGAAVKAELVDIWHAIASPLYGAVEGRGKERADSLRRILADRAAAEAESIATLLSDLRTAIEAQLDELEGDGQVQLTLDFDLDEREQFRRDLDALRRRLDDIPSEIEREQDAIRNRYADPVPRLFPAAVTFLLPPAVAYGTLGGLR
ncbi:MAG: DISARM system SNF2-like helicase DrmD [Acidimicrobiales bacterium]